MGQQGRIIKIIDVMKQYTNKTQTAKLLGMGYPPPQRCPLTSNTPAYSIGELLSFIEQNGLCYSLNRGSTSGRYVFMKYYPFAEIEGEELIEVLYKACMRFFKED